MREDFAKTQTKVGGAGGGKRVCCFQREETTMAFGERLQALRRARGLTQEDLAAELKVSRQAVSLSLIHI